MRGKPTPHDERARAVGIALVTGSTEEASRQTGVPGRSIREWVDDPEFADLRQRTRDEVADEWWAIVQKGFRRVSDLLTDTDDLQKAAVATAIVTDKMLLIRGEATSRTESTLLAGRSDHEQRVLGELINTELERRADADADGAPLGDPVAQPEARQASPA